MSRLRARWATEDALRAFADDLDDATGDLIAANLILGARRRGAGLASVLDGLAESVAADVRARREIEADRAKPRATARWVTIITVGVLAVLALTGDLRRPLRHPARAGASWSSCSGCTSRRWSGCGRWPPGRPLPAVHRRPPRRRRTHDAHRPAARHRRRAPSSASASPC